MWYLPRLANICTILKTWKRPMMSVAFYFRVSKPWLLHLSGNFFTLSYDMVPLRKYPYLGPIVASVYQKFLTSAKFQTTVRSSEKATFLVWSSLVRIKSSKDWSIRKVPRVCAFMQVGLPRVSPFLSSISSPPKMKRVACVTWQ